MVSGTDPWRFKGRRAAWALPTCLPCLLTVLALSVPPAFAETDPLAQAHLLKQEVDRLYREGRYNEAIPKAREILALREQALGPTHPDVAASVTDLAHLLRAIGDYAAAKHPYEEALRIYEQALGPSHSHVATALNNLAGLLLDAGDVVAAKPLYERALHINEQALGPQHPRTASSLNNLAEFFRTVGDYAAARSLHERALETLERALGPNHPDVAVSLNNLGVVLQLTGDYRVAKLLHERALRIKERALGPNHPDVATSLNNLSELLRESGDFAAARPFYERALQIKEGALGPNHPDVARSMNNLAILLHTTGDYALARPLYERALQVWERALGPNHPELSAALNNLARLLQDIGDYGQARPFYERALQIKEGALGPNHPDVASTLDNLALLLRTTGDYAGAWHSYERALKIRQQALGPTHPGVATSLTGLATLFQITGQYAAARLLYERALDITVGALGPTHPNVAADLNNLANLLSATGDYSSAFPLYERALRLKEIRLGPDHPTTAQVLENLAFVEWDTGRPEDATPRLARAVAIVRKHTARGLVGLSHRQKLVFLETTGGLTDTLLSLPSGLVPNAEAYRAVLDRKNLLFRTLAAERTLTEANSSPQVAALIQDYTAVRRYLARLGVGVPNPADLPGYRTQLASLTQQLETLEAELSRASTVFAQAWVDMFAGPSEVCAALPVDGGLLDFFWYSRYLPPAARGKAPTRTPHYVVFVLGHDNCADPIRVDLGPAAPIDEDVRRLRDSISRDAFDPATRELRSRYRKSLATRLYAKLFPPTLQKAIAGKPRLLIAPDGALALLPFGLLSGEDAHEFLLETRTISYVPSGRDLLGPRTPSATTGDLLAVGAPAYDQIRVQTARPPTLRAGCGVQDEPFAPLQGTAMELKAIAEIHQKAHPSRALTLLEGPQATKDALLAKVSRAGVLHLATHAYFAGDECTPAGLMAREWAPGLEPHAFLGHNPLLLAGIALTGANDHEKGDGIMTALEVTALDLRGTSLVVLSACDTGLGTAARGQELLGLRWAFAYAGAKNLVTSLWSVPDAETTTLMTHFYTGLWVNNLSVPEALRAGQLEMLKAARARGDSAPHAWGSFLVSGKPD